MLKTYFCGICETLPDQLSHHKSHLKTQKHKTCKELVSLKMKNMTDEELIEKYKNYIEEGEKLNRENLLLKIETIIHIKDDNIDDNEMEQQKTKMIKIAKVAKAAEKVAEAIEECGGSEAVEEISKSFDVSNRDALKDKIHEIHNYLRNNGAGYGMNALKVFNILYGLKKIEEGGLLEKAGLSEECRFSELVKIALESHKDGAPDILSERIYGPILDSIAESSVRYILLYEISRQIPSKIWAPLIKMIDDISRIEKSCDVLLSGKIYEYFIGRDETAISELGAYFTDRHLTKFIFEKKLAPEPDETGQIEEMIDMFGGSGGFTTGYIDCLKKTGKPIHWETEIHKVFHFDMNEDVIKAAGLEFFSLTGELPKAIENIGYRNSFTCDDMRKYKYVITNPPYGGDKTNKSEGQMKREKVKDFIKEHLKTLANPQQIAKMRSQLTVIEAKEKQEKRDADKTKVCLESSSPRICAFAKKHKLGGNDKESVSLMLMMDMLEVGGTSIGVLKEGVFFNKTYKDLRRVLVQNFRVREVISIPSDQFENTSTKTSIVIFDNMESGDVTSEIKFSDLKVLRYEEDKFEFDALGNVILTENKGDICDVVDEHVSSATLAELLENPIYSLNGKDYTKKELTCGEGYELVKLGDITDIKMGGTPSTKNSKYWEHGTIPWVSIADLNFDVITDTKKKLTDAGAELLNVISKGSILLSFKLTMGKMGIAGCPLYCNEAIIYINSKLKHVEQMYLYYIIQSLNISQYARGTIGTGNLNKDILTNLQIPLPKSQAKMHEWTEKISGPYNEKNMKQKRIEDLEKHVQEKIKAIETEEECEEVELGSVLIRCKNGKTNTTSITNSGEYPFYSATASNPVSTHNTYDFDSEKHYFLFAKSGGNSKTIYGESLGIGKFWLVKGKAAANIAMIRFDIKDELNVNYINSYLKSILHDIQKFALYTTGNGNINVEDMLQKFKLKIPKNNQIIQAMETTFQEIEQLQHEVKQAEELYKQYIAELGAEALGK
jgi:type I restriction-modification system DNA methylase subunit